MKYFIALFALILGLNTQAQQTISGVTLPGKLKIQEQTLVLNGGGLREKYFLDLYVGGLYLTGKSTNAEEIIKADKPMAIKMEIISSLITSEKMIASVEEGMEKSTKGNTEPIRKEIEALKKAFSEDIKIGDIYILVYVPGEGLHIYKNGKNEMTIKGLAFKQATFGIWLCDDPADEDLKEGMLGLG